MPKRLPAFVLCLCFPVGAYTGSGTSIDPVAAAEAIYADANDANSVIGAIDSGFFKNYRGKDRSAWQRVFLDKQKELAAQLAGIAGSDLSASDARVMAILHTKLESFSVSSASSSAEPRKCQDRGRTDIDYPALREALVGCFTEIANSLRFEGTTINRASALGLLGELNEPQRRESLFRSFIPLWEAINGGSEPGSPYRRMIAMAAADGAKNGSAVDAAARTVGVDSAQVERWLQRILEQWREATGEQAVEPWDYRYLAGETDRSLAANTPSKSFVGINRRFYRDLGANLDRLGVRYDLDPRPDKSSVAYTDFLIFGREVGGRWQPTIARVLANYSRGGLSQLNELVHENGHAVHINAIRNRPIFVDWPDDLFVEAFADVPSWSTYEPAWQHRYLGAEAPEGASLRNLYGNVMLDVAWGLFEIKMLRDPNADPNAVWTDITSHYLHIVPHPELSWWAVRVQLVDAPGYMLNYGLGAVLTADLRAATAKSIGTFDAGNPRWYPWLAEHLLRFGSERDTPALLREFLGRPVSPDALLTQLRRMAPASR